MGKIGNGYGSEWHLLRFLGYHRTYLTEQILSIINGDDISWLDFNYSSKNKPLSQDKEWKGLDFIDDPNVLANWNAFWPKSGNAQNWDAVGKISLNGDEEWLLVEAKAHIEEVNSKCQACSHDSKEKIRSALEKTKHVFGAASKPVENWLAPYYQYANRLAVLHFLMNECKPAIPARLLFIYFLNDKHKDHDCPKNKNEWSSVLSEMESYLGIDRNCYPSSRVHHLFLNIHPASK